MTSSKPSPPSPLPPLFTLKAEPLATQDLGISEAGLHALDQAAAGHCPVMSSSPLDPNPDHLIEVRGGSLPNTTLQMP